MVFTRGMGSLKFDPARDPVSPEEAGIIGVFHQHGNDFPYVLVKGMFQF